VSARVSALEEHLEVRLLHRTTRKLSLTEAGADFYQRCVGIVADVEEAVRSVTELQASPQGKLRVTSPVELTNAYLGSIAAAFCSRYPEVELEIVASDRLVDLVDEGFEVGIRIGTLPDSSFISRRLAAIAGQLYASPRYLEERGTPETPAELADHACIVFSSPTDPTLWKLVRKGGERAEIRVDGRLSINSLSAVRDAVVAGLGIASMPLFMGASLEGDRRLQRVLPDWRGPEGGLYVVFPSSRHLSAKVRSFVDFLSNELSPPPWSGLA
jgi:DNA-binding transcriptional LysR family regulator